MKEEALSLVSDVPDPGLRLNLLREYVQTCVLRSLHESEAFLSLSFVGGSALRFLFSLPRFSEDLDFSVEREKAYAGTRWMQKVKRDMSLAGFDVSLNWNDRKTVHVAWIRVAGLLREAGVAAMADQRLSIKIEIDTRPPAGAVCRTELVNRHRILSLQHHDLASLMAGKVHALVTRKYPKGRDWYDFIWYRARRPPVEPNLELLQHALDQTRGANDIQASAWKQLILDHLSDLPWDTLSADVAPFLERPEESNLITPDYIRATLQTEA